MEPYMTSVYPMSDLQNYKKNKAALTFISELQKGRLSGEQKDWLSKEEVEKHFKEKINA